MFTGLIQSLGEIREVAATADGVRLAVDSALADELAVGDSIAVNGVCLTATRVGTAGFAAEVMNETLRASSLREVQAGGAVNLELPLRAADRLGGHVVQGHVDGVGTLTDVVDDGFARRVAIKAPAKLMRYVVVKGSIAVDGVSLTVAECGEAWFTVSVIPETLARTNLGRATPGTRVNLEVDVLAKYVERLLAGAR
ncbi:MAG: riboflavin synthase [Solirubrobacterales bacterium]|nr:riboflavin synthase [Solirubrobacterales bacterium]